MHDQSKVSDQWFEYFVKSGFEREPLMLDKQMIPHDTSPLDVGSKKSFEPSILLQSILRERFFQLCKNWREFKIR